MKARIRIFRRNSQPQLTDRMGLGRQDNHAKRLRQCEQSFINKNNFAHHINIIRTLNALLMILRIWILRWLCLLLVPEGALGWPPWARQEREFRRWEMLYKNEKMKLFNRNTAKPKFNLLIESRLRILRWLSMLLLSAGLVGWSHRIAEKARFRQSCSRLLNFDSFNQKNISHISQTINRTMGIQLRILHWLSLLLLSEGRHWQPKHLRDFSWYLYPEQKINTAHNYPFSIKQLKTDIL